MYVNYLSDANGEIGEFEKLIVIIWLYTTFR